jgi:hypothetical protein
MSAPQHGIHIVVHAHLMLLSVMTQRTRPLGSRFMLEIVGYVALGIACITCALVLGSAFDDR